MKKWSCLFVIVGLLMVALALPTVAADTSSAQPAEETDIEAAEEIEIEDEETPLAGLPGVGRTDVARVIAGAGGCMIVAAGAILITGLRREHARR